MVYCVSKCNSLKYRLQADFLFPVFYLFNIESLSASIICFIQHTFNSFIKLSISIIFKPPFSYSIVSISLLIFSGLPSHINLYIRFSILFTVSMGWLGRDEKAYINFGRVKFFYNCDFTQKHKFSMLPLF